jgi:hypothetical protein
MNELSPTLRPVTITPKPRQGRFQRLSPVQFIELTGLVAFAQACLAFAQAVFEGDASCLHPAEVARRSTLTFASS